MFSFINSFEHPLQSAVFIRWVSMSAEEQCALCFLVLSLFCPEVLEADLCYSSAFFHLWPTSFFVEMYV